MHHGFKNLENFLIGKEKIIISTHESPDGDGLGAEIAFNELMINLGKKSIIMNSDPIPDIFQFIDHDKEIRIVSGTNDLPQDISEYVLIILDTNDFDNIGQLYPMLKDLVKDIFIIDHHEGGEDKFEKNFIMVESSSACEIIYTIILHFGKRLSQKAAQALFAGILYDTGSFRYPKTTPRTFSVASHLVELGADPSSIFEQIYEKNSLSSFELRGQILSSMEILYGGRCVAMKLTGEMLLKTGASFTEGEGAINLPLTVKGVIASILVKQDIGGGVKVSLRTKGEYNVAEIAIRYGGGGHRNAAGYKSKLSLDGTYRQAIKSLEVFFN